MRRLLALLSLVFFLSFSGLAQAAVDINTASAAQLETLPGIGPSKASAIIEYRNANGPFSSVEQLDNVPGIGPATLSNLRALVTVGDAPAASGDAAAPPPPSDTSAPAPTVSSSGAGRININTASAAELERLPGIGPSKAAAILDYRNTAGAFASCDALANVKGIGAATVSALRESCTTE